MCLFISGPLFPFLFHHWQQWLMIPAALKKQPLLCLSALEPQPRTSFCSCTPEICLWQPVCSQLTVPHTAGTAWGTQAVPIPPHSSRMFVNFVWSRPVPHLPLMVSVSSSQVTACCSLERLSCIQS